MALAVSIFQKVLSSIFPTGPVVTGGYFIMGRMGPKTFPSFITIFVRFRIHLTNEKIELKGERKKRDFH